MPADSEPRGLPLTWRPLGVRIASVVVGGALFVICGVAWVAFDAEVRDAFNLAQRITLVVLALMIAGALWAMSRSRVVAEDHRIVVVNGFRTRVFERAEVVHISLPQGAPWATVDLADGTSVAAMGVQGSDGDRAKQAIREIRAVLR